MNGQQFKPVLDTRSLALGINARAIHIANASSDSHRALRGIPGVNAEIDAVEARLDEAVRQLKNLDLAHCFEPEAVKPQRRASLPAFLRGGMR